MRLRASCPACGTIAIDKRVGMPKGDKTREVVCPGCGCTVVVKYKTVPATIESADGVITKTKQVIYTCYVKEAVGVEEE